MDIAKKTYIFMIFQGGGGGGGSGPPVSLPPPSPLEPHMIAWKSSCVFAWFEKKSQ